MDYVDLEKLNSKFAEETKQFNQEFIELYKKWFKKSPRLAMVMTLHMPINLMMNMIESNLPIYEIFPDLPDVFIRFVAPFIKLREKWGKIPGDEFANEYRKLYQSQFNHFFSDEKDRENFSNWFEGQYSKNKK